MGREVIQITELMAQRKNILDDEDEDIPYNNIKKISKSKGVKYTPARDNKRGKKSWRIRYKEE